MRNPTGPHAIAAGQRPPHRVEPDPTRRLRRAAVLHLDGDLAAAEAEYVALLDDEPDSPAALNNLGLLRAQRGDVDGALAAYDAIGAEQDLSPTALLNKANAYLALADTDRAVPLLHRAVTLDPDSSAWVALGQAHLVAGDVVAAEAAFRQAHERLPERVDVLRSYASCLAARGEVDDAASLLAAAVRLNDRDPSSWRQLGAVLLALRDLGSAAHATRTAAELEPEHVPTLRQLAVVLVALGRPDEAAQVLDRAVSVDRDAHVLVDRAVLHLAGGDTDAALDLLDEAVAADPAGRARLYLAYALLAAARVTEACAHLEVVAGLEEPFAAQAREALERIGRTS
jgi:tetratricopeptide (TPR) repeat protein